MYFTHCKCGIFWFAETGDAEAAQAFILLHERSWELDPRPAFADRDRMCSPPTSRYWWTFERSCKIELNNNKECKIFHSLLVVRARVWTMTQYENNENVPSLYRTKLHTIIPADSNTAGTACLLCGYFHFHCFLLFCVNISVVLIQNKESHFTDKQKMWMYPKILQPRDRSRSIAHCRLCHFEHWLFWCLTFNLLLTKKSTIPWRKVFSLTDYNLQHCPVLVWQTDHHEQAYEETA